MSKEEGLWADLNPVQQFLYYEDTWSNFFGTNKHNKYKLIPGTGFGPSESSFTQVSGGVLARW